jgi:tetratricopeptide (TPR) repeat protein
MPPSCCLGIHRQGKEKFLVRNNGSSHPLFIRLLRGRAAVVLLCLYLLAALGTAAMPLFGTLGYESALIFGLLAAWLGALLPFSALWRFRRLDRLASRRKGSLSLVARWLHLTAAGWLLLVPPMALLTANALRIPNCAMFEGALFWLLIPFMTVAFTAAVLLFLNEFIGRRAGWMYYALLLLLLLQPFVQVFTQPQIFAYNHVFGMFLGLSWDQSQPPFATLALYRLSTLAYALLLLVAATALRLRHAGDMTPRRALLLVFLPPLVAVLFFHFSSDRLGFTSSYAFLRAELGAEYRLGNIRIVYDSTAMDKEEVRRVAEEHLFQLERVCAELGVRWESSITSYVYPDSETKRRLLGTESSDLARPWRGEIHVSLSSWSETVKHELVHVVAGKFGPYIIRAPFVRVLGLTEGLAMAIEWSWGNRTLHESAAGMLAQGLLPHASASLGTAGFVSGSSSRSYVAAGSLTRWLMDSLGVATMRRAYASDDVEGTVGMDYNEIDRRWRVFLSTVPREIPDSLAIAYAFRRPSLFSAACPRVITERNRDAAAAMAEGRPARALALYRAAERLAPNARSAFGIVGALYELGRWDSVIAVTDLYLSDTSRAFSLYPMLLWQGAAAWQKVDSAAADRAFSRLIAQRLPGWTHQFTARLLRALRRGKQDGLAPLMTALLRRGDAREDSLRREGLTALLRRDPLDPVVAEEFMRAVIADSADRSEGRRRALAVYERIEHLPLHYDLRMLAVRLLYQERNWREALRLLRHQLNEVQGAAQRDAVTEWMARCVWQLRRAGE